MFKILRKKKLFLRPMTFGEETYSEREYAAIVHDGNTIAELSPLRGLHKESLDQALSQLKELLPILEKDIILNSKRIKLTELNPINLYFGTLNNQFKDIEKEGIDINKILPSVIFTLECMILNLVDKKIYPSVPICHLDFKEKINMKTREKPTCLKIKIGRESIESEHKKINDYLRVEGIQLRLDGNNLFKCDDLIEFIKNIPKRNIQYVEDPFINNEELKKYNQKFIKGTLPSISLDNYINTELTSLACIQFATLKPNLIGGFSKTNYLAHELSKNNIHSVISSSFEPEVGIENLNKIHLQFPGIYCQPPGLDTLRYFRPER